MTEIRTCRKKAECMHKCARINSHTFVCARVYVHTRMLIFRCLYLPGLTRLGVWGPKSCWVLPALTLLQLDSPWFIFRYFLYPGIHLVMPSFSQSSHSFQRNSPSHSDFTMSSHFMWMEDAHEFMDFCMGGLSFRGRLKMISQPAVQNMSLWMDRVRAQSPRQLFCSGPYSNTEGVVGMKWTIRRSYLYQTCEKNTNSHSFHCGFLVCMNRHCN